MKVLRVLTGIHAGARLSLAAGAWRVQRLDANKQSWEADEIALTDWYGAPLKLHISAAGCVSIDESGIELIWPEFEVRLFGDVVLCMGGENSIWPSDATLLATLPSLISMKSPKPMQINDHSNKSLQLLVRNTLFGLLMGMTLLPIAILLFNIVNVQTAQSSQLNGEIVTSISGAKKALDGIKMNGLRAREVQGRLVVEGIVNNAAEDALVRKALLPFSQIYVVSAWQTATQVSDTITTALGEPGVRVRHLGGGDFVVEGSSANPDAVQSKANKIKSDFSNLVSGLEVRVQTKASAQAKVSAMLSASGLSYVVRPDGSKSFLLP